MTRNTLLTIREIILQTARPITADDLTIFRARIALLDKYIARAA